METVGVPYLREVIVFLLASVVIVPVFRWLRTTPILGYLAVGVAIGPHGLAIVPDPEGVARLAELGVVFLLFNIGLELSFNRLASMRSYVFGIGPLQIIASALVIGAIAYFWGNTPEASVIIGGALALSSTAIVMQLLIDRNEFGTRSGRLSFGVLLVQDIAVVPLLMLVTLFGGEEGRALWITVFAALARGLGAVVLIVFMGRFVLRRLFHVAAWTRSPELFMAMTLLVILATAMGTAEAGLSMALGAFLAGLLLAETEFRPQIESDLRPFRGLLLGLFFISVGMSIDFSLIAGDRFVWIVASVLGLLAIKAAIVGALALAFGAARSDALRAGLLLAGCGEFAFVILGSALALGVVPAALGQFMIIVAGLTMLTTPALDLVGAGIATRLRRAGADRTLTASQADVADLRGHVVIAGFGRVGRIIAQLLSERGLAYVALDLDIARTRQCRLRGEPVFYGDAAREDVLERVGIERAAVAVVTLNDYHAAARAVAAIRKRWPKLPVFVRARDADHRAELEALGPAGVVPETLEASLQLASHVLQALGTPSEAVAPDLERIRQENYAGIGEGTTPNAIGQAVENDRP